MGCLPFIALIEIFLPESKLFKSLVIRPLSLIRDVICSARKCIDAPDVRTLFFGNEERCNRKVLVVRASKPFAELKCFSQRRNVYHGTFSLHTSFMLSYANIS